MTRPVAAVLGACIAGPLLILGCTGPAHVTAAAPVEARDIKPTPIVRALPAPTHRASRSRPIPAATQVVVRAVPAATQPVAPTLRAAGLPTILLRIRSCESGANGYATHGYAYDANYTETNPASTASGGFQFLDSTWQSVTGLTGRAMDYSPAVQDAAALKLFREQGTSPWLASQPCWGR